MKKQLDKNSSTIEIGGPSQIQPFPASFAESSGEGGDLNAQFSQKGMHIFNATSVWSSSTQGNSFWMDSRVLGTLRLLMI